MQRLTFEEALTLILQTDTRYPKEAYVFLRLALNFTIKSLNKPDQGPARHITGRELLDGIRQYAVQEFGPLSRTVLAAWGITRTEDFGEIVFTLVSHGILGKTDQDKKEDFSNCYSFHEAFVAPFLPAAIRKTKPTAKRRQPARKPAVKDSP